MTGWPEAQFQAWTEHKAHTIEVLNRAFPGLSFEIAPISLGKQPAVIPILGEAGEGGRGIYASAPPPDRLRAIEAKLARLNLATPVSA